MRGTSQGPVWSLFHPGAVGVECVRIAQEAAMSAHPQPAAAPPAAAPPAAALPEAPLLRRDADGVATLTLNRPAARNALSLGLMAALEAELQAIRHDPAVTVVILAAAGPVF